MTIEDLRAPSRSATFVLPFGLIAPIAVWSMTTQDVRRSECHIA